MKVFLNSILSLTQFLHAVHQPVLSILRVLQKPFVKPMFELVKYSFLQQHPLMSWITEKRGVGFGYSVDGYLQQKLLLNIHFVSQPSFGMKYISRLNSPDTEKFSMKRWPYLAVGT